MSFLCEKTASVEMLLPLPLNIFFIVFKQEKKTRICDGKTLMALHSDRNRLNWQQIEEVLVTK